jgi:3-hydroxyisobutyrate dehydrogenase
MTAIGFIGLGNMGRHMARNLVKAGHAVKVFDVVPAAVAALVEAGATAAPSAGDAAATVEVVVTMLPAGPEVRQVYLDAAGVLGRAAPNTLLIDSSTIDVDSARAVAKQAEAKGLAMLDAPVSGGVGGAEAGSLTFMVGGTDAAFARAKPVLDAMGKTIVHAGPSGNGQVAKLCNNMLLAISMIGTCEAFGLAEKLGLKAETLFAIASKSTSQCWAMTSYCPAPGPVPTAPSNRGYAPGFTGAMMLKDLKLAQQAAIAVGAATPMGAEAAALYGLHCQHGGAPRDFSAIMEFLQRKD